MTTHGLARRIVSFVATVLRVTIYIDGVRKGARDASRAPSESM